MAREFSDWFYRSHQWESTRNAYMETPIDTPWGIVPPMMCERCFEEGKIVPARIVHHRIWLSPNNINDPEVTLNFRNLKRVCMDCHAWEHHKTEQPRVRFDEFGNVLPR